MKRTDGCFAASLARNVPMRPAPITATPSSLFNGRLLGVAIEVRG